MGAVGEPRTFVKQERREGSATPPWSALVLASFGLAGRAELGSVCTIPHQVVISFGDRSLSQTTEQSVRTTAPPLARKVL